MQGNSNGIRGQLGNGLGIGSLGTVALAGAIVGLGWLLAQRSRQAAALVGGPAFGSGRNALRDNAERALRMKREAGPQTHIPEHRTAHQGGVQGSQVGYSDTILGRESTYTSNLKRSHNARTGDA